MGEGGGGAGKAAWEEKTSKVLCVKCSWKTSNYQFRTMLTFSLFLISVVRHPGQRFLLYDGALLQLAVASSCRSASLHLPLTGTQAGTPVPPPPRADGGTQQLWAVAGRCGRVRYNSNSCLQETKPPLMLRSQAPDRGQSK